ncbi:MAG: hypothetical protein NXH73_10080 [Flavobacteriaceae bacterium]|nr:hypothetical protein [Flavobacteriaceae bacterium]
MKTNAFYVTIFMCFFTGFLSKAQETTIEKIDQQKEKIFEEEREALRIEVEKINEQLDEEQIAFEEATNLKQQAAEKHALNIENRITILENQIALNERNKPEGDFENEQEYISIFSEGNIVRVNFKKERKYDRRTTSDLVFAVGFNNVITKGESLDDSQFKIGGSRFAELGWAWKTRVFKNSNWLRFKYGFSFQFNGLKPINNQIFVEQGEETVLEEFPLNLDKSKFRMDNLVFPIHFEMGPSKKTEGENYFRYSTRNYIKFGLGGYAGFNLANKQKLKFEEDGNSVKQKLKDDYNTNNFIYGLSAYVGWRTVGLYAKYDLNTIFKDNPVEQRNVSLGLRWDMD